MSDYLQKLENYKKALNRLIDGIKRFDENDDLLRDGLIQRFEFTFELAWKTIKDALEYLGLVDKTGSPRENIQLGFRHGIIEDGEKWIEIMLSRNLLSHLYDEKASRDIYNKIKSEYIIEFKKLRDRLEEI